MPSLRIAIQDQVFEATVPAAPVRVGSGPSADICIASPTVAAEHCVIEPLPNGALKVKDAKSGRPTQVNGNTIRQVSLKYGDEIRVGDARIRLIPDDQRASTVPPAPAADASQPPSPAGSGTDQGGGGSDTASVRTSGRPARGEADSASSRGRPEARKPNRLPWMLGGAAVVLVAVALVASGRGTPKDRPEDEARLREVAAMIDDHRYADARPVLEALRDGPSPGVAAQARKHLRAVGRIERAMQAELDEHWLGHLDLTPDMMSNIASGFGERYGDAGRERAGAFAKKVRDAQQAWLAARLKALEADAALARPRYAFAEMMAAWDALERSAPAGVDTTDAVAEGRAAVRKEADEGAAALVERARNYTRAGDRARAVTVLRNALAGFEGLPGKNVVAQAVASLLKPTKAKPPKEEPSPKETPDEEPSTTEPAQAQADNKQALEAVGALLRARDLSAALARSTAAGLTALADDITAAQHAMKSLQAHINEHRKSYRAVPVSKSLRVNIKSADDEGFTAVISGGTTTTKWARAKLSVYDVLLKRWKPEGVSAYQAACLLHVLGDPDAAQRWLVVAGASGAESAAVFSTLARWRDEGIPEGGYVVHEGRYVSPAERDRLVLEATVQAALSQLEATNPTHRAQAYATLLRLGKPAAQRFRDALKRRRARLVSEIAAATSFTGTKHKRKLYGMLKDRRAHALSLIRDAKAYPYPNPNKQNQAEVEKRVDAVRQVWERPFELVVEWDKDLKERMRDLTELDEARSKLDPDFEPDLSELADRISKAIDMPAFTPDGKSSGAREYSLKVLGFNERLPTTATKEERNNVRSVNAYRMMMGMRAVKINERLTRAARGHSRHMKRNGYFAHNVPAGKGANAKNRTPGARAKVHGYGGGVGENIAMGCWSGHDAFLAWFGSSGHHRNMLGRWTEMGAGRSHGSWWTQLFGAAGGRSLKLPDELPRPAEDFAPEPEDGSGRPVGPPGGRVPDEAPPQDGELDEEPPDDR